MIQRIAPSRKLAAMGFGFMLAGSAASSGAIIVQELFDNISPGGDSSLNGKGDTATSVGMTGTWATNTNTGIYTASNFNTGAGLPGLPSNGGSPGGVWNNTNNYDPSIYATRPLASSIDFGVTQTVYFSVLVNNSGDTSMGIGLSSGSSATSSFVGAGLTWNNARSLATGANDSGNAAYISYGVLGTTDGNNGVYGIRNHEPSGSINGAALIVGQMVINSTGADFINIVRYEAGDTIASSPSQVTWSVSDSVDTSMVATNLVLWMNGVSGNGAGEVDGIRFGTTWTDVTGAVPESGSALLGAVGVLGFFLRRRRR